MNCLRARAVSRAGAGGNHAGHVARAVWGKESWEDSCPQGRLLPQAIGCPFRNLPGTRDRDRPPGQLGSVVSHASADGELTPPVRPPEHGDSGHCPPHPGRASSASAGRDSGQNGTRVRTGLESGRAAGCRALAPRNAGHSPECLGDCVWGRGCDSKLVVPPSPPHWDSSRVTASVLGVHRAQERSVVPPRRLPALVPEKLRT